MFIVHRFLARRKFRRELAHLKSITEKETKTKGQVIAVHNLIGPVFENDENMKKVPKWRKSTVDRIHVIQVLKVLYTSSKKKQHAILNLKCAYSIADHKQRNNRNSQKNRRTESSGS